MTRRKYRTPQGFKHGGAVPADDVILDAAPAAPEPPPEPAAATPAHDAGLAEDAVAHALRATIRAEELQRADPVDRMQGLSDRQRSFLKQNRALMRPEIADVAREHYQAGRAQGLADDSPELERYILEKTAAQLEQRRKLREAAPVMEDRDPEPAYDPETRRMAMLLDHEAQMLAEPPEPVAPPPISRRQIQYSAPVARDVPSMSSGRPQSATRITLSPEERAIARNSFSDPTMTAAEKELSYARQKALMLRRRSDGTLNE